MFDLSCDVAVIGAGIAGVGVAAKLAPDARVVVIEAEDRPGAHATGRSAAIFLRNYGGPEIRALTRASDQTFTEPPASWGCPPLLSPRGQLMVAGEAQIAALEHELATTTGFERISPAEALALVPILRPEAVAAAAWERDARDIDVDALHQAWLRLIRRHGGQVLTRARVTAIDRVQGIWLITAGGQIITAPVLVNAAGAWADAVATMGGARPLGLQPRRRSMAVLPQPGADSWPLFGDAAETWYAKPAGGALMVSPADEDPIPAQDAAPDDLVLAEGLDRFERATRYTVRTQPRAWAGLRTFAPDRVPVVGYDSRIEGFFWLAGQGGYGIQSAPALSRLAANLVQRKDVAPELAPIVPALSPARFS